MRALERFNICALVAADLRSFRRRTELVLLARALARNRSSCWRADPRPRLGDQGKGRRDRGAGRLRPRRLVHHHESSARCARPTAPSCCGRAPDSRGAGRGCAEPRKAGGALWGGWSGWWTRKPGRWRSYGVKAWRRAQKPAGARRGQAERRLGLGGAVQASLAGLCRLSRNRWGGGAGSAAGTDAGGGRQRRRLLDREPAGTSRPGRRTEQE